MSRAIGEGWNRFLGDGSRFLVVGAMGIGVNQFAFWTFAEIFHVHYLLAAALATQVSTTFNFLGIEYWAFTGRGRTGKIRRFVSYDALNTAALVVRVPVLWATVTVLHASSGVGNLVSIFVLLAFRYAVCDLLIWPVRRLPEGAAA
ncbi:MAG TPA: GtrA family protein [Candidatus Dormibacteraeota bacterium]|nr:GtrA family protein [Candidatus Dormibacteraeota bacterium]